MSTVIPPAPEEMLEKIRQQFNEAPYPNVPLEQSPLGNRELLYNHSLITAYYRREQKIVSTTDKLILDVGCGSGYKSLTLAGANPGARVVGIDISEASVDLSQKRLAHYGFENSEFHVLGVEDLPQLGMQFDYINCDETLYLLTDPVAGLTAMREVLKSDGLLRVNFHSSLQRHLHHQVQEFAQMTGLMDESKETSISLLREFMASLKPQVTAKAKIWNQQCKTNDGLLLANHLLRGDKGWTIPQFFAALRDASLEFVSMVEWEKWDLLTLFEDIEEVPLGIAMALSTASQEEQLHIFELLHSQKNRLLDLWCGHPDAGADVGASPLEDWTPSQWQQSRVALHPQVATESLLQALSQAASSNTTVDLNTVFDRSDSPVLINGLLASCLLRLCQGPALFAQLKAHWKQICPFNFFDLTATTDHSAYEAVRAELIPLVELGYLFVENLPEEK